MDFCRKQVKSDLEQLLGRFKQTDSVRFQVFASIWKEMNFSHIFYGTVKHEKRAFARLVLDTAYRFFLPPFSFQIRVGGLYLLYSLYQSQTASPREQIRLALKDWDEVKKFEKDAADAQHLDTIYILRQLMFMKAFHFTAMPTLLFFKKSRKVEKSSLCEGFLEQASRLQELINSDLLEEMSNVHDMYEKLKSSVFLSSEQTDSSVSLIHKDMVPQLHSTVIDFFKWQQRRVNAVDKDDTSAEGTSSQQESSRRAGLLASIKSKAYGQAAEASKSRRHRQVELDFSSSDAGPSNIHLYTRIIKPSLKARTKEKIRISGDMWKEAMKTTYINRLTSLESCPSEKKILQKRFKWN